MQTFTINNITFQHYTDSEHGEAQGQLWASCKACGSHERVARAVQHAAVARLWADDYVHGPYRHTCPSNTNTNAVEAILDRLGEDDLRALEDWRRLMNRDSTHLGGPGRTMQQMREAARAWDALSHAARQAYHDVLCCLESELEEAIQAVGAPEDTGRDIEAVEALLGPDHPFFRILPAFVLVGAYQVVLEQVRN